MAGVNGAGACSGVSSDTSWRALGVVGTSGRASCWRVWRVFSSMACTGWSRRVRGGCVTRWCTVELLREGNGNMVTMRAGMACS
jgi:hypothetical protein